MTSKEGTSIYAKARTWWILLLLALPIIVLLIPAVLTNLGLSSQAALRVTGAMMLVWFVLGAVQSFRLACPVCGRSLFMRGFISVPWPAKTCSKFKSDLTAA